MLSVGKDDVLTPEEFKLSFKQAMLEVCSSHSGSKLSECCLAVEDVINKVKPLEM